MTDRSRPIVDRCEMLRVTRVAGRSPHLGFTMNIERMDEILLRLLKTLPPSRG